MEFNRCAAEWRAFVQADQEYNEWLKRSAMPPSFQPIPKSGDVPIIQVTPEMAAALADAAAKVAELKPIRDAAERAFLDCQHAHKKTA